MKIFLTLFFSITFSLFFFQSTEAAGLKIGSVCTSNSQCQSGDCESSTKKDAQGSTISYCDCGELSLTDSASCAKEYGGNDSDWNCKDGMDKTFDLDYCLKVKNASNILSDNIKPPLPFESNTSQPGFFDFLTDTEAAILTSDIQQMIDTPQPRIRIPGVSFTAKEDLKQVEDDGNTYFSIPYLGEYISSVYQYAIIVIGILAVIMIVIAGFQWIMSAGSSERIASAKKRITGAVIGLVIALSSYTLLFTINPELVQFRNLRVLYVQGVPLEDVPNFESHATTATTAEVDPSVASKIPGAAPVSTQSTDCKQKVSKSSGSGNIDYLGQIDCHAYAERKSIEDVKYVIIHEGGTTVEGTLDYWKDKCQKTNSCVGTHYIIERNGAIYQIADEKKVMAHTPGGNWNSASIGIDLMINPVPADRSAKSCLQCKKAGSCATYSGKPKTSKKISNKEDAIKACLVYYENAQYQALNKLLKEIASRTGVTLDGNSIRSHCNTAANHYDPRNFDYSRIGLSITPYSGAQNCLFYPSFEQGIRQYADSLYK